MAAVRADRHVSLSLVSHTNVGKTTLARTLLGRDIGEIRDEAHVTDTADRFVLLETPEGDVLSLWDTPGFGDSHRLARRLEQSERPLGWLGSQVLDRVTDRALYSSQQAVRNVRDEADVVLYLVNAAEDPGDAAYVDPEMKILEWIGKPIVVLVNQMGPPTGPQSEQAEVQVWTRHLADTPSVRRVLPLDAFARCWVQEGVLLAEVGRWVPQDKQASFGRLRSAWMERRRATFETSMALLGDYIARAALDREVVPDGGLLERLRDVGSLLRITRNDAQGERNKAMAAMARRLGEDVNAVSDRLIHMHGLEGRAGRAVLERLAEHFAVTDKLDESRVAVFGGLFSGALGGLYADVASGGMTLGGGMIIGGLLGVAGGMGLARGYNWVRGADDVTVTWTAEVMNRTVSAALTTYLAIAHHGRGRGQWAESEHPRYWDGVIAEVMGQRKAAFDALWEQRGAATGAVPYATRVRNEVRNAAFQVLQRLYPDGVQASGLATQG